jgi:hypothetical protein
VKPDLTCTGNTLTCKDTVVTTHVTVNNPPADNLITYSWSGTGLVSGGTTATASWNQQGAKVVTVTFTTNACTNTCTATVAVNRVPPPCAITPADTTIDQGGSATLCGPSGSYTYLWSTGAQTQCIVVGPGSYWLITTLGTCTSDTCSANVHVKQTVGRCWLTGGGQSYDHNGHLHSYGGVVNPGCSPTAAGGGNWNDLDHTTGAHFKGLRIVVDSCGNVPGIPPGSNSPKTPFNFIDFHGTGQMFPPGANSGLSVYFTGHYEDRHEPGSKGQPNEDKRDRYFLRVFTNLADPVGSTIFLVDVDGNPATVDPVVITHGNLQLHISGCDKLAAPVALPGEEQPLYDSAPLPNEVTFGLPRPNPTGTMTTFQFSLPQEADVNVTALDVSGRLVRVIAEGATAAGWHAVSWDLRDQTGTRVRPGMYFVRMMVDGKAFMRHVVVLH